MWLPDSCIWISGFLFGWYYFSKTFSGALPGRGRCCLLSAVSFGVPVTGALSPGAAQGHRYAGLGGAW